MGEVSAVAPRSDRLTAFVQAHRNEDIRCKGLKNIGHTCYINCIIQYIVNSPVTAFFLTGLVPEDPPDAAVEPDHPLQVSARQRRDLVRQLVCLLSEIYEQASAFPDSCF